MVKFCCEALKFNSRRREPNVPEELKSDAYLEYGMGRWWFLRDKEGGYRIGVRYCPWCGSALPDASS
jgi:hypothetical protein